MIDVVPDRLYRLWAGIFAAQRNPLSQTPEIAVAPSPRTEGSEVIKENQEPHGFYDYHGRLHGSKVAARTLDFTA